MDITDIFTSDCIMERCELPESPVVERLGKEDAAALAGLESLCFSAPWPQEQIESALTLPHFIAYGIKDQGRLLAYIFLSHIADEMEVLNIATLPEARRCGLGRCLLGRVLKEAPARGVSRVLLEVRTGNTPARRLYASFGMEQVGVRKHYYADTGEDALVLEARL